MIDDRDDQEGTTLSNSNSDNNDNDGQYSAAGFNDAVDNDSISEGVKDIILKISILIMKTTELLLTA